MPATAEFIDRLREAFGKDAIDRSIKRGMRGEEGWFHARENGHEVGTPFAKQAWVPATKLPEGPR